MEVVVPDRNADIHLPKTRFTYECEIWFEENTFRITHNNGVAVLYNEIDNLDPDGWCKWMLDKDDEKHAEIKASINEYYTKQLEKELEL